jgi:hypothetical protein
MRHCPRGFLATHACLPPAQRPSHKRRGLAGRPCTRHHHTPQIPRAPAWSPLTACSRPGVVAWRPAGPRRSSVFVPGRCRTS